MPPLNRILDYNTHRYKVRILLTKDNHPCKQLLLQEINTPQLPTHGTGLRPVVDLLKEFTNKYTTLKDTTHHSIPVTEAPDMSDREKTQDATESQKWTWSLPDGTMLFYTEGSKLDQTGPEVTRSGSSQFTAT